MATRDLLALQALDTKIDQLKHQVDSLPEKQSLMELDSQVLALTAQIEEKTTEVAELQKQERTLEHEADDTAARMETLDKQLYGGSVTGAKDMQALQTEIEHLKTRRGEFDEQALALMDQIEPVETILGDLVREKETLTEKIDQLKVDLMTSAGSLQSQIDSANAERTPIYASIPEDVRSQYEKLRAHLGGVGVAEIVNGSCTGCHMSFSAVELQELEKAGTDKLTRCEQCGRILVL